MKKFSTLCLGLIFCGASAFAQNKDVIGKAISDPKKEASTAKADIYIQDKTIISEQQQKRRVANPSRRHKKPACNGRSCKKNKSK